MKKNLKTALVLCAICAVAALLLALINAVTAPRIAANEAESEKAALKTVALGQDIGDYVTVDGEEMVSGYYRLSQDGYIISLKTNGYGGQIILLGSYTGDGVLQAATILSDSETPGLGKKAENPEYMDKFIGKSSDMPTRKTMLSDADAQAVSGASITFGGVSKALLAGSEFAKKISGGQAK